MGALKNLCSGLIVILITVAGSGCATSPQPKSASIPDWLDAVPKDNKYFYAVGISGQTRQAKNAWDQAILRARAELGKTIITHVTSQDLIISSTRGEYARQVIKALSDTELNFTEVTERWWDRLGNYGPANYYYVLVRLEKKRAEQILKDLK